MLVRLIKFMDGICAPGWRIRLEAIFLIWAGFLIPALIHNKEHDQFEMFIGLALALWFIAGGTKMLWDDGKNRTM